MRNLTANSGNVNENSLDFGLVPIDLNLLPDDVIAFDVEKGIQNELANIGNLSRLKDAE